LKKRHYQLSNGILLTALSRLLLFLVLFPSLAVSQKAQSIKMNFRHLGVKDALIGGTVSAIVQSRTGFMWFGMHPGGLYKYDGYSLKKYTSSSTSSDSTGLLSDDIRTIAEDSTGNIWIGTFRTGLYRFEPKTGKFFHFSHNDKDTTSLSSDLIHGLITDSQKRIWILTAKGLDQYDPLHQSFIHYRYDLTNLYNPGSRYPGDRYGIVFDHKKGVLILTYLDVFYPDPKSHTLKVLPIYDNNVRVGIDEILPQKDYSIGVFIYGEKKEYKKICKLDVSTQKVIESYCDFPAWASQGIVRHDSNFYYMATTSGLFILNTVTKSLTPIEIYSPEAGDMVMPRIWTITSDRNKNLWVCTRGGGIYILDQRKNLFVNHSLNLPIGSDNALDRICRVLKLNRRDELMMVTTPGKVYIWDSIKRDFKFTYRVTPDLGHSYVPWVNDVYEDRHGNIWAVVTNLGPIFIRNVKTGASKRSYYSTDSLTLPNLSATGISIYEDRSGLIWVGSINYYSKRWNDFACINDLTGEIRAFRLPHSRGNGETTGAYGFFEDKAGRFWIGSDKGLYLFDRLSGKFTLYSHNDKDTKSLGNNRIAGIIEDKWGRCWVGTSSGLDLFDRTSGTFTHFTEKDGLSNNNIIAMLEANDGSLWMTTLAGVSRFDPESKTFTSYSWDDGIYLSKFLGGACSILPSGEMFFGAEGGVLSFFPEKVSSLYSYAPLVVTSFSVAEVNKYTELFNNDSIVLRYDENDFSFEFAALDFGSPRNKRYAYMLEGLNDGWITSGSKNYASFTNIPPGDYIFRVKAMTRQGKWDPKEIAIYVYIAPPFWGTWWFRTSAALLILGSVGYAFSRREKRRKQYLADLEAAREKERLDLASELHDGPLQDLYATRFMLEPIAARADENARQLDELLTKVRSDLRTITSELQIPRFDLGLAEELLLTLDAYREIHKGVMINVDVKKEDAQISDVLMQNMFRIFRTALANIQKHAEASEIVVYFRSQNGRTEMTISDNGVGFIVPSDIGQFARSNHYGLFMMKNFAEQMGAKFEVHSEIGKGTSVTIILQR
jgi:signal transduction histidine kinase/ligand-binding sensor domain-containing protein